MKQINVNVNRARLAKSSKNARSIIPSYINRTFKGKANKLTYSHLTPKQLANFTRYRSMITKHFNKTNADKDRVYNIGSIYDKEVRVLVKQFITTIYR